MLLKKLGRYTKKKKLRYGATFCSLGVRTRRCLASYMAATVQTAQFFSLLPDRTFKRRENRTTKWDGSTDIDGCHSAAGRPLVFLFFIVQSPNSSDHPYFEVLRKRLDLCLSTRSFAYEVLRPKKKKHTYASHVRLASTCSQR